MGFKWIASPEKVFVQGFENYRTLLHLGILAIANRRAPEIEAWMKQHATWTDQTGNARQSLHADVVEVLNLTVSVEFDHGMDYGYWLEMAHAGRYGVITPALDVWSRALWNDVKELMRP